MCTDILIFRRYLESNPMTCTCVEDGMNKDCFGVMNLMSENVHGQ